MVQQWCVVWDIGLRFWVLDLEFVPVWVWYGSVQGTGGRFGVCVEASAPGHKSHAQNTAPQIMHL